MPKIRVAYSWRDNSWEAELSRLAPAEQSRLRNSVLGLIDALKECSDVLLDSRLSAWLPKRWHPHNKSSRFGVWADYRLGDRENRGRAIVCCIKKDDTIYLVAKTAIHDYDFCTRLIEKFNPDKNPKPKSLEGLKR